MSQLRTSSDLLDKLRLDFVALRKRPEDCHAAFNFFATAVQLIEWLHVGPEQRTRRREVLAGSTVLRICSDVVRGRRQMELAEPESPSDFRSYLTFTRKSLSKRDLFITLDGDAERKYGRTIRVVQLAAKAVTFWENYADLKETDVVLGSSVVAT